MVATFALIALASLALSACGDDDNSGGGSNSGATDESYMAAICKASLNGKTATDKLDPASKDATKTLADAMDQFAKELKAANPPADVKSYHDSVVKYFQDFAAKVRSTKDLASLSDPGSPPKPPQAILDRLKKISDANADCKASDFNFD